MNKIYLFISASLLVLSSGCTSTSALNHFQNDPKSANAIQFTQKSDLLYNEEIKAMIFATYLNGIDKKYKSEKIDSFLIGIHLVYNENNDFQKDGYTVTLNGKNAKSIVSVDKNSELVKIIPLKNNWANYYIMSFDKNENKDLKEEKIDTNENEDNNEIKEKRNENQNLKIEFIHSLYGQTELTFQR